MTALDNIFALNQALSQADRVRAAPSPGRVEVDGRSLADLLAFAADYGHLITFYDLTDTPDGCWSTFFEHDPSIALALRASLDLASIQADFDRVVAALLDAGEMEARVEQAGLAVKAIRRLAGVQTLGHARGDALHDVLNGLIASERRDLLAAPARRLQLLLGANAPEQALRHGGEAWVAAFADQLDDISGALLTTLDQGRDATLAALEASFGDKHHPPQSGLYDAFAVLFGHAQTSINRLPARLVRFYQSAVLHQTGRAAVPDTVCLTFTPAKGKKRAELHQGTRFVAGTDKDGETIAYKLDSALAVDLASVAALRTLTVTTVPIGKDKLAIPAQVRSGTVALADKPPAIASPFPIFGAAKADTSRVLAEADASGVLATVPASLGFAIASPTLLLRGGTRSITIGLTLTEESLAAIWRRCGEIGEAAGGLDPECVFVQLLEAAFALRYSTAGGWVRIEGGYEVTPITEHHALFVLSFVLNGDADPFVALATTPPAADAAPADGVVPASDVPVLVASLRQDEVLLSAHPNDPRYGVMVHPYAVLSGMTLSALSIEVEVTGLAELDASTPNGPVDTSQPFLLFGSPPVQGATLDIAAPELFAKRLTTFEIKIAWFGLPVTTTGFQGYYKAYVVDANGRTVAPGSQYDNQSFQVGLDVYNPGWWQIAADASPRYLFRTAPHSAPHHSIPTPDGALLPQTLLVASVTPGPAEAYYDPSLSAIRLSLAKPDTAFGNILYAPNVMAASVQLTAAASACAQQCGHGDPGVPGDWYLAAILAANTDAPDGSLAQSVKAAAQRTVAALDGAALEAIEAAIAASDATPETREDLRESLSAALDGSPITLLQRLRRLWGSTPDAAAAHASLDSWLVQNGATIPAGTPAPLTRARALLDAGSAVLAVRAGAAGRPAQVARPMVSAGLRDVQARLADALGSDAGDCIQQCMQGADLLGFPNQPWLPTAASITIDYTASTALPGLAVLGLSGPAPRATFYYLLPFDGVVPVPWLTGWIPLLFEVEQAGALLITLSDLAEDLTLLFQLAPPAGGWPTDTPALTWAQADAKAGWKPLVPLRDTTNGLSNSGIVSLTLNSDADARPVLRVGTATDPTGFPDLAGLVTNAAMASWVGPGGAELGTPLPAGTITKPASPLPNIGSIDQPMPSSGGAPPLTGADFELWLAERLRHKDRGIQAWDYANLVLAEFPSLWQVAVVPASNGGLAPVPGSVWIVPIPGPKTPAIADPAMPSSDSTMLTDIHSFLSTHISPFIDLRVTNPHYLRIRVIADLIFTDDDSLEASKQQLNDELIQYLSPWPTPALGPRPDDYYTLNKVAHFIRNRPYVRAILSLELVPEMLMEVDGWHYLTTAASHCVSGKTQSGTEPILPRVHSDARETRA